MTESKTHIFGVSRSSAGKKNPAHYPLSGPSIPQPAAEMAQKKAVWASVQAPAGSRCRRQSGRLGQGVA